MAIRVVFADDSYLIREGVTKLRRPDTGMFVLSNYSDPEPWFSWH